MYSSVISFRNRNPLLGLWHKNVLKCDPTSQALLDLLVVHYVERLPSCTFSATEDVRPTTQVWHRVASARRPPGDKKFYKKEQQQQKMIKDLHFCNQLSVPGCQLCCCLESLS